MFVKWDRRSQIVLKKNPNYWVKGIPKIDNVIFWTIFETSTRLAELISGNIDFGQNYTPEVWEVMEKNPNVAPLEVPILRVDFWQFDGSGVAPKGPWNDKRVRQAIIHAIDRKTIMQKVMGGHGSGKARRTAVESRAGSYGTNPLANRHIVRHGSDGRRRGNHRPHCARAMGIEHFERHGYLRHHPEYRPRRKGFVGGGAGGPAGSGDQGMAAGISP